MQYCAGMRLPAIVALAVLTACAAPAELPSPPATTVPETPDSRPSATPAPSVPRQDPPLWDPLAVVRSEPALGVGLEQNAFDIEDIVHEGDLVHLLLAFEEPVTSNWIASDTCEMGGTTGPITGAHFVVSEADRIVVARSPRWGELSCIPLPGDSDN
jgi:hypothetical protein